MTQGLFLSQFQLNDERILLIEQRQSRLMSSKNKKQIENDNYYKIQTMSRPKFEISTFKYENISTRMERLKQNPNYTSTTSLRSASSNPKNENKILNKNASTNLLINPNSNNSSFINYLQEDNGLDLTNKYSSGRVAKNTGIRKYNQRMIKQAGNINKKTPPKYVKPTESIIVSQSISPALNPNYLHQIGQSALDNKSSARVQISTNQFISRTGNYISEENRIGRNSFNRNLQMNRTPKYGKQRTRLEPGKIYTRNELELYFAY